MKLNIKENLKKLHYNKIKINKMIQNNFSVQIYDQETDNKLDIIYINNIIDLDDNDNDFTRKFEEELLDESLKDEGYNINDIYYSIL